MTVIDARHTSNYINRHWATQTPTMERPDNGLLDIKPCGLPALASKSRHQNSHLSHHIAQENSHTYPNASQGMSAEVHGSAKPTHNSEFKSRLRLGIYKGNATCVAMDPEHHLQLVKEKQALHEQRTRAKSPIILEPVHVLPLSRPKTKKTKTKNQRLSRSAPELVQTRNAKQEMSSHLSSSVWTSDNHLQLPLLTRDSNVGLGEIIEANSTSCATTKSGAPHPLIGYISNSPEPRLQIISAARMNQLKSAKQNKNGNKPMNQSLKSSQSTYAALREQRLLSKKLRAFDSENLSVSAQSYHHKDVESILEMVEQAQSQLRCPKQGGRRSCGICPPTAGTVKKGRADSAHLPELTTSEKTGPIDKTKRALIVQLPNIMYSRSNTPFL